MMLLVLALALVGLLAAYSLLVRLLRTFLAFLDEAVDMAVALLFWLVIVPPLWLWQKGRRPMWRTLTKQQSQELQAWLHRQ